MTYREADDSGRLCDGHVVVHVLILPAYAPEIARYLRDLADLPDATGVRPPLGVQTSTTLSDWPGPQVSEQQGARGGEEATCRGVGRGISYRAAARAGADFLYDGFGPRPFASSESGRWRVPLGHVTLIAMIWKRCLLCRRWFRAWPREDPMDDAFCLCGWGCFQRSRRRTAEN